MNQIEQNLLTRCLGAIYGQLLTGSSDSALDSLEELTFLVRYMTDSHPGQQVDLEEELYAVRTVFQICRPEAGTGIETDASASDLRLQVDPTAVLYEICQHGLELLHSGVDLRKLALSHDGTCLRYCFFDREDHSYGGTIYAEGHQPKSEP